MAESPPDLADGHLAVVDAMLLRESLDAWQFLLGTFDPRVIRELALNAQRRGHFVTRFVEEWLYARTIEQRKEGQ